jgi:hypothetical protein
MHETWVFGRQFSRFFNNAFGATNVPKWCLNLSKNIVYLRIMKRLGKIVVCLASGLVLNAGARADDSVLPNNPYAPIVVRNIFALNPPQPVDAAPPGEPPPKITPNGIMTIFGHLQVLFKVAGTAKPGQPAKDEAYILSEGQRQDEIEVTQIDEKASLVTFNNHGTVQELPLVKANPPPVSAPMAAPAGVVPGRNFPTPGGIPTPSGIPTRFGGDRSAGGAARSHGRGDGSPLTTVPTRGPSGQSGQFGQPSQISPEAQAIMLEAQREQMKQQGNPAATIIPPTALSPLTPGAENSPGGMPPMP